jgi:hypothetical protein
MLGGMSTDLAKIIQMESIIFINTSLRHMNTGKEIQNSRG